MMDRVSEHQGKDNHEELSKIIPSRIVECLHLDLCTGLKKLVIKGKTIDTILTILSLQKFK